MRSSTTPRVRSTARLAAAALLLLTLAGCTSSAAPGHASGETGGATGGATASSDAEFSAARDAYDLKLAECLRGKGFDIKDPRPGQGIEESSEEINAAASICMSEIGDPPVYESPMTDAEIRDSYLKTTACYRELGYQIDDPELGQVLVIPEDATAEDIDTCSGAGQ